MKSLRPTRRAGRSTFPASAVLLALVLLIGVAVAAARGAGTLGYPPPVSLAVPTEGPTPGPQLGPSNHCPKHFLAVGGGAHITGTDPDFDLEIQSTAPDPADPRTWINGIDNSTGFTAQVASFVICERGSPNQIKYRVAHRLVAAGGQGVLSVSCPSGTHVTGGGVGIVGDHRAEAASSEPTDGRDANKKPDDGWFGVANNGTTVSQRMTVTAVCSKLGHYKVVRTPQMRLADNTQVAATARCPAGTRVTGGGVGIRGFDNGYEVASSFPIDGSDRDKVADDGWTGVANNDGQRNAPDPSRDTTMNAFAVCKVL